MRSAARVASILVFASLLVTPSGAALALGSGEMASRFLVMAALIAATAGGFVALTCRPSHAALTVPRRVLFALVAGMSAAALVAGGGLGVVHVGRLPDAPGTRTGFLVSLAVALLLAGVLAYARSGQRPRGRLVRNAALAMCVWGTCTAAFGLVMWVGAGPGASPSEGGVALAGGLLGVMVTTWWMGVVAGASVMAS